MATAYLNDGATALETAANWSDGTGVASDATLVIPRGSQTIPGVNLTTPSGTGVDYWHIMKGYTGSIGGGGTSVTILFDATYTTKPNLLWESAGFLYVSAGTSTCTNAVLNGSGTVALTGGTWTNVYANSGTLIIGSGATVTNLIYGGGTVIDTFTASLAFTSVTITGGGSVSLARQTTTCTIDGPANVVWNAFGETMTTLNQNNPGSSFYVLAGNITTANIKGMFDVSQAQYDVTIGGTATNIYPTGSIMGDGNTRVTLSNVVKFGGASQAGPDVGV